MYVNLIYQKKTRKYAWELLISQFPLLVALICLEQGNLFLVCCACIAWYVLTTRMLAYDSVSNRMPDYGLEDYMLFRGNLRNKFHHDEYRVGKPNYREGIPHFLAMKCVFFAKNQEEAEEISHNQAIPRNICRVRFDNSLYGSEVYVDYMNGIVTMSRQLYEQLPIYNCYQHHWQ